MKPPTSPSSATHFFVPKWALGLYCAVSLALLLVAIIVPIKNKQADDTVSVSKSTAYKALIPRHDIFTAPDPFDRFNVSSDCRAAFERVSRGMELRVGQVNQIRPDPEHEDEFKKLLVAGGVGSILWTVDSNLISEYQAIAVDGSESGVPLVVGFDVIHGHAVTFPVNLGMAAAFEPELIYKTSAAAAREGRSSQFRWAFSPMVDLVHDPRWGRVSESFGESPYLAGKLAAQHVRGFQDNGVAACVKHIGGYGAPVAGRDYNAAEISDILLHNEYLPAYREALVEGGALTVMASYNTIDGIPTHVNRPLLTDVIRGLWGWDGLVVADFNGVADLQRHGVFENPVDMAVAALEAGVDMSMGDGAYYALTEESLRRPALVGKGKTISDVLDIAVKRVLAVKDKLNLFADPHDILYDKSDENRCQNETLQLAEEAAKKAMVLLKNSENTLPLELPSGSETTKPNILMVGALADNKKDMLGSWAFLGMKYCPGEIITYKKSFDELKEKGLIEFEYRQYLPGFEPATSEKMMHISLDEIGLQFLNHKIPFADIDYATYSHVIFVAGEHSMMNGECASRTSLDVPELAQIKSAAAEIAKLKASERPKIIEVLHGGRPMTVEWEDANLDAIIMAWSPGTRAGPALKSVIFGEFNPSGHMPMTTPRNVGQIPIVHTALPGGQPCGDLCDTPWDGTRYYAKSRYLDSKVSPLYPFGYGLSYTDFQLSKPVFDRTSGTKSDPITISVEVENTGLRAGATVIQLYIRDLVASVSLPLKRLKGFQKVDLQPNTSATLQFVLHPQDDFGFYNSEIVWTVEPGKFQIFIGFHADDDRFVTEYTLEQ